MEHRDGTSRPVAGGWGLQGGSVLASVACVPLGSWGNDPAGETQHMYRSQGRCAFSPNGKYSERPNPTPRGLLGARSLCRPDRGRDVARRWRLALGLLVLVLLGFAHFAPALVLAAHALTPLFGGSSGHRASRRG